MMDDMGIGQYILDVDGRTPVRCHQLIDWGMWIQNNDRHVAQTYIRGIHISTVFLGLDHSWGGYGDGRPVLFETMVFGGSLDQEMDRYCTWEEAEAGHDEMVKRMVESEKWHNRMKFILTELYSSFRTKVTLVKRYVRNRLFSIRLR